jgi:hypothetical protein
LFVIFDVAFAEDLPAPEVLRAIAEKLPHQPQTRGTTFQATDGATVDPICNMKRFTMTLATGSTSAHSLAVLLDRQPVTDDAPVSLVTVLRRLVVDADGSPRSYHPEDPHGTGRCQVQLGPNGERHYRSVCALEDFASAHVLVFRGAQQLRNGEYEPEWRDIWPLIRDKTLPPLDIKDFIPSAPNGYYFFYWKERGQSAFFKREIIPQASDGYPCRWDSGYFVAATTLRRENKDQASGCTSSGYIDSERIKFLVMPDDAFGNARVGDIVVAQIADGSANRVIYGVVGDTGPVARFGEASIAFNRALLENSDLTMNNPDTGRLEIEGTSVAILILGGTKSLLRGDYSQENIDHIGRQEFARWSGDDHSAKRLDACIKHLGSR